MKRKILAAFAAAGALCVSAANPIDKSFPPERVMSLGSYYYPEQWPMEQWDRDLSLMADMGIDFTHFGEFAWGVLEPEDGKFDFEWLDKAVDIAAKKGLKVVLCTPSATPPVWLTKNNPDVLTRRDNGVRIEHGRRQHASWSSEKYRRYVARIVEELAKRYGNNPAVIGWQIDNEPGHYGLVDYSDNAQESFRRWLKEKYGTIENLNKTWGTNFWSEKYQNFDQILLPSAVQTIEKPNPHAMLDMNNFHADEVSGFVNMQADILHKNVSKDQWVTTNLIPMFNPIDVPRFDHLDFTTYTRYPVVGTSGIGGQGFRIGIPEDIGWPNATFRNGPGKAFGVMELQPGQVNWGEFNPQPLPGALRMWIYHIMGDGGRFVCNYRFRQPLTGSEQHHYGMVGPDGVTLEPGGHEFVRLSKEFDELARHYDKKARMPRELADRRSAILMDMNSVWETEFQPQTNQWNSHGHLKKYYNTLTAMGAPVDVISEREDFGQYPFLIVPAHQLVDSALVARWDKYARDGGNLVITVRTGLKDRNGKLWEAPFAAPIHDLAGIDSVYFDHMPGHIYGKVSFDGKDYDWNNWADVISPRKGTESWGVYADQFYAGKTAVTHRRHGKGTVTYIGVDTDNGALEADALRKLFAEAGVTADRLPYGIVRTWRDGGFNVVLNYTSDPYDYALPAGAKVLVGEATLPPAGVLVYKL